MLFSQENIQSSEETVTTKTVMEGMHQVLFRIVEDEDSGRQEEEE